MIQITHYLYCLFGINDTNNSYLYRLFRINNTNNCYLYRLFKQKIQINIFQYTNNILIIIFNDID